MQWYDGAPSQATADFLAPSAGQIIDNVDANLVAPTFANLTVTLAGTGTGTVTSNVGGISCPRTCKASFATGAPVTLTATPAAGPTPRRSGERRGSYFVSGSAADRGMLNGTVSHEFSPADDFPHPVQPDPGWSESLLVQAYCPEAEIGFFAHSNRCHFDPDLWSEVVSVYLPGDRFAVAKGFGYARSEKDVGGCLSIESPRPFEENVVRYRGAAQLVDGQVLRDGPAPSGIHTGLDVELTYRALGVPFGVGDLKPGQLGHTHYEQHAAVAGHITLGGERIAVTGTGFRDHTWGPRDLSVMGNHHWMHGAFGSGRWFSTMIVSRRGGGDPLLDFHVIGDANGMTRATLTSPPPLLDEESQVFDPWQVTLQTDDATHVIAGGILKPMPFSFVGPVEMTLGVDRGPDASHAIYESQTRVTWDGQVGYGLSERSVAR